MSWPSLLQRLSASSWRIPLAVLAAAFMLLITELAYQSQRDQLDNLVTMGRSRILLTVAVQRVTDAESGKRGYLLVGGRDYLEPYLQAREDVHAALMEIRRLDQRVGDAELVRHQGELERLVEEKLGEMQEVLRRHDEGHRDAALDMVRSGIGREIMQRLRLSFEADMAYRNDLIANGLRKIQDLLLLGRIGIGAVTVLCLLILVMFIRQGRVLTQEREAQRKALIHEKDRLEQEVESRTGELKALARHLQTAREDERARLARDLHDELGALLTTAKLDVAVMRPQLQQHLPELAARLTHLTEALNSGIALKRRIIEDLCPSSLRTLGLSTSLSALLHDTARVSGLQVNHDLEEVHLSADDQLTVYRIVQEAITNTLKYAQASRLIVRLFERETHAVIEIEDNGRGFDVHDRKVGSHGLQGMRFRVEAAGGQLDLFSQPGEGTRVTARLPLCAEQETEG